MSRAVIVINGNYDRDRAAQWAKSAPSGCIIEFKQSKRTLDQNARLWACLTEIARKVDWYGQKLPADDWKDVFTAALRRTRVVPGIDAGTFVPLGMRTSDMTKQEFSDLLELINAFAAEHGVTFDFDDNEQTSSASPSADETGSGEASPHAAAPDIDPSEPNSDEMAGEPAGEATAEPDAAGSPVDHKWIKSFAKVVVASIGPDEADIVAVSKSLFRDGLTVEQRDKARSITNYCRAVARNEMEKSDALDVIAGVAGMDVGELAA